MPITISRCDVCGRFVGKDKQGDPEICEDCDDMLCCADWCSLAVDHVGNCQ